MQTLILDTKEIKYKVNYKKIKHLYLRVREDYLEINCPKSFFIKDIEEFIYSNKEKILPHLEQKRGYFLFGKEVENISDKIYKDALLDVIFPLINKYEKKMNLKASKVSFRFNKSRWGSCSSRNSIVFNYYLAKLPLELIEYVVVHELAHIRHKNHSKLFWEEVKRYLKDYKSRKKALREFEKRIK